ncbi:MAG TPA: response regulator [Saprospiraceae bacterium]|nr:response regulator [Saprospiraceae bacterium]HMQ82826.1 response regulator [Saprospiraceae bacterium]
MRLYIVSNNENIIHRLRSQWSDKHKLVPMDQSIKSYDAFDAVIVVEPYILNKQYLSIASIWKTYLARHAPATKLIVAGFGLKKGNPNYLPLLDIDSDFDLNHFINNALPVSTSDEIEHIGNGYDQVVDKLKLFFKGHNQEGIIDSISKIRQVLNNAELSLYGSEKLKRSKEPFEQVWKEKLWADEKKKAFQYFYNRWLNYKDYFLSLPFYHEIQEADIASFVQGLHHIFSKPRDMSEAALAELEQAYRKLDPFNGIGNMVTLFRQINSKYVTLDYAGHILLIDDDPAFHQQLKDNLHHFTFSSIHSIDELEEYVQQKETDFDLILLDLGLDDSEHLAGLDWISRLKQQYPHKPLGIVTVHDDREMIFHTIAEEKADFFFSKSTFDAEKWATVLIGLKVGKQYSLAEILLFNQSNKDWEDKPAILVVEDEDDWYQRIAELSGEYHFERASTIEQAKDALWEQDFDLLILDLYFKTGESETTDGLNLIQLLQERYPDIPLLVVSKDSSMPTRMNISKSSARKFLFKEEFDAVKWLSAIQALIQIKKQQERLNAL